MIKVDSTEDYVDYDELKVKVNEGYVIENLNNEFINESLLLYPLYKKIEIDATKPNYVFFPYNDVRVECYCNECKKRRIFCFENSKLATFNIGVGGHQQTVANKLTFAKVFNFKAKADCKHFLFINFIVVDDNHVMKIGQYPSIYDFNEEINNKKFLKLLGKEYESYYKSACSLYSFNTCIGAMVYLRRIFEKILIDTFIENEEKMDINLEEFKNSKFRIEDKLKKLREFLPALLFENGFSLIYSKISHGIHNLTETECEEIFPILKGAIEEILIDKIEKKEQEQRRKKISSLIEKI